VDEQKSRFLISTYKYLVDQQAINDADIEKPGMHFISKKKDTDEQATGLGYYVIKGSLGKDFKKAVRALKTALKNLKK
jgi:hypothetical protein